SALTFLFSFYRYVGHPDLHSFLHDALPISHGDRAAALRLGSGPLVAGGQAEALQRPHRRRNSPLRLPRESLSGGAGTRLVCPNRDRKSTRLNSSHVKISYAVFCLKKKKKTK